MKGAKGHTRIIENKIQFFIGLATLCLGALVYVTLRSPDQIYFTRYFGIHEPLIAIQSPILKTIGRSLPAFLHVFSFSLITASFFRYSKTTYTVICTGWLLVNCLFELGQKYKTQASRLVFDFFDKIPFLESTRNFFLLGSFDWLDVMAFVLGSVAAFLFLLVTTNRR
jgi:hypothetical protein